ncbi:hypothetical protein VTG60DRAFT_2902 [Thermothelomyces hinnuleus]
MTSNAKAGTLLSALANAENIISHLRFQTTYGLIVELLPEGAVDVRLSDTVASKTAASASEPAQPGYQYYIWPDYKTSFVWYQVDWAGNPEGETHVDEDDLKERYGEAWERAREAWVDKYTRAFEAYECHLHSYGGPIFTPEEQKAWIMEGVMLAAWLALQPGVDSVEFLNSAGTCICLLEKTGLGAKLATFLESLDKEKWD